MMPRTQPSVTPLFLDAMWRGGGPFYNDIPPAFNGEWMGAGAEMHHFAIERHGKGVNILYFDSSVRNTRAKDLWSLPWSKGYDVNAAAPAFSRRRSAGFSPLHLSKKTDRTDCSKKSFANTEASGVNAALHCRR